MNSLAPRNTRCHITNSGAQGDQSLTIGVSKVAGQGHPKHLNSQPHNSEILNIRTEYPKQKDFRFYGVFLSFCFLSIGYGGFEKAP